MVGGGSVELASGNRPAIARTGRSDDMSPHSRLSSSSRCTADSTSSASTPSTSRSSAVNADRWVLARAATQSSKVVSR